LISVSVISVLLFSFAPITLFFLISVHDYNFFLLLNVAIFAFTGLMGVKFLYQAMQTIDRAEAPEPAQIQAEALALPADDFLPIDASLDKSFDQSRGQIVLDQAIKTQTANQTANQKTRTRLLQFWLVLYALVGSQLGWTLRPFFGAPGESFQLFRSIESNFYSQVFRSLFTRLGWN
jgi:hypothetical protein